MVVLASWTLHLQTIRLALSGCIDSRNQSIDVSDAGCVAGIIPGQSGLIFVANVEGGIISENQGGSNVAKINLSVDLSNQANIDFCDINSAETLIFRNYAALNICDENQTGLSWNDACDASGVADVNALITAVDASTECQADGLQM
jgi:hypothetical protein